MMTAAMIQNAWVRAALLLMFASVALACHGTLLVSGITEEEKRIILQEHNRLRQLVATGHYPGQPAAENMREIVWDDELAARAQQWADNCQFRHDPFRTINRFTMGQNLAIIWSTAPLEPGDGDFASRIQSWFNEVQKYSFGDAWSPKTGHYSQLVWGETSLVGCGFAEYRDASKYNKLYVCNYGPGGNVIGFNPYEVGKPSCATYGMKPSAHYQGLCAAPNALANSISSNTIETYEYTQSSNKQTAYSTNFPQPAPPQPSPIKPKQASDLPETNLPLLVRQTGAAANSNGYPSGRGPTYGGTTAYASVPSHLHKYKNKLEAYKPSAVEFKNSVRKHTILRSSEPMATATSSNSQQQQQQQQRQQQQQQQQEQQAIQQTDVYVFEEAPEQMAEEVAEAPTTTVKPVKRGWSLLTWRG